MTSYLCWNVHAAAPASGVVMGGGGSGEWYCGGRGEEAWGGVEGGRSWSVKDDVLR